MGRERTADTVYPVDIFILASDRQGLLRDISEIFSREKINVIGVNTQSAKGQARMSFTAEICFDRAAAEGVDDYSRCDRRT